MSKPVISVENLSKAYRIGVKDEIPDTLVGAMTSVIRSPFKNLQRLRRLDTFTGGPNGTESDDTLWALKDVSFDVQEGEVVGIIGRNGAGKSTLLKVLSRITEPTSGRVVIRGRVSSLLEVGTGFHPELTGRDNIYMNGTILGMTKREIDRKFDEIVDFSGVEKFLDTPTKRYSSGMQVRLAFAVAAHLEPEILIIDEVLAVGDVEFQSKCMEKIRAVASDGRTILFVSHNLNTIARLTEKCAFLENGGISIYGDTPTALNTYGLSRGEHSIKKSIESCRRDGNADPIVKIKSISVLTDSEDEFPRFEIGEQVRIEIHLYSRVSIDSAAISVGLSRNRQPVELFSLFHDKNRDGLRISKGVNKVTFGFVDTNLLPGVYSVDVGINPYIKEKAYDVIQAYPVFEVINTGSKKVSFRPERPGTIFWEDAIWEV
ncbi:ABC transporter ATP-binding protein [Thalassoglobus polymorphus]|uniref:Teichoic acids export ATP-binding protein TagH n=1 Tax=Thalassoglobus polymorphus TaxID=2527994 RepID=A0A517QSM6_9PLAN|nr:ABC transporter ATP-binding protein [Thalassoglobus polymorphus]QDT34636.1 Teichoic acids export ATP-binding protein TagH [Thalassoglobus polymorphus]